MPPQLANLGLSLRNHASQQFKDLPFHGHYQFLFIGSIKIQASLFHGKRQRVTPHTHQIHIKHIPIRQSQANKSCYRQIIWPTQSILPEIFKAT